MEPNGSPVDYKAHCGHNAVATLSEIIISIVRFFVVVVVIYKR